MSGKDKRMPREILKELRQMVSLPTWTCQCKDCRQVRAAMARARRAAGKS
jgi:hypothetical protein